MVEKFGDNEFSLKRFLLGSIGKKIFFYFFLLILASILFLGSIFYFISMNSLNIQVKDHLETTVQSRTSNIETYLNLDTERINLITSRTQLRRDISNYISDFNESLKHDISLKLNDSRNSIKEISSVCFLDLSGKVVVCDNPSFIDMNFSEEDFFIKGKVKAGAYFFKLNNSWRIVVSAPIYENGSLMGLIITVESFDELAVIVKDRAGLGETGEVLVAFVDKEGNRVYPLPRLFEEQTDVFKDSEKTAEPMNRALMGENIFLSSVLDYRNVEVAAATSYISSVGLGVVAKMDMTEAIGDVKSQFLAGFIFTFIFFSIFFSCLSYLISRKISNPLVELTHAVEKMNNKNFNTRVRIKTGDELEKLGEVFNKMALQLEGAQKSLETKVKERTKELSEVQRNLERKSLQANRAKIATLNILEDVEESKEKLDEAYKQLRGLEKLKNEFLSFTSHELKTPLTPILIQAQMLQEGDLGKISPEQKKSVDMIVRNMKTLNQLIGDVLDVSIIQSANLKIFPLRSDITEIIRQTVDNVEPLANQKNIKITTKLPRLHHLLIDNRRIGQVVANLLSNAIKFTPENGSIVVEAQENSEEVTVKVIDTGIGISPEKIKTLFQPFSQVVASYKLKQKGTGLGLAICKGIISAHKGKIGVQSEPGKGSTFYFTLPRRWHFGGNKNE